MSKAINFNAGPAAIPASVLNTIHQDLFNWQNTGISILETGHRSPKFLNLGEQLEDSVRRILKVPSNFAVLFLPGGAQIQFAMTTMNLVSGFQQANYVETGYWSAMALKEAQKYTQVHIAASSRNKNFTTIPPLNTWNIQQDAAFLHFTDNETIGGVEFPEMPTIKNMILVSDMSSNIFTRSIDFSQIGCVYACAQKNLGIAGMSLVIVRRDLLDRALPQTPTIFHYATQEKNHSLACTPTTFSWYVASLILDWIEAMGGIKQMAEYSSKKASLLYDCIDTSNFYINAIEKPYRSRTNVPFKLINSELEAQFFTSAEEQGLYCLQGHRSSGGARASLYNAISVDETLKLVEFLKNFAKTHG